MRVWLKNLRMSKELTQEKIAKKTGITRTAFTNIENGERNPSVTTAKKIAEILEFEWTKFFEDEATQKEVVF